jgi:hypothetical protein
MKKSNSISGGLALLIFASIPFIQLGVSYYISVAFLVFIIAFGLSINSGLFKSRGITLLQIGIAAFFTKTLLLAFTSGDTRSIFYPLRELTCFLGMLLIPRQIEDSPITFRQVSKITYVLLTVILLLVIVQLFQLSHGKYFGFPIEYFIMNQDTLKGVDLALEHGTRYRSTSFYGEPSYTSWIVLSLITINLMYAKASYKSAFVMLLLSLAIVILSQSIAGILAVSLVFGYWFFFGRQGKSIKFASIILGIAAGTAVILLASVLSKDLGNRFEAIIDLTDKSSNIRFQDPLFYINKILTEGQIFGVEDFAKLNIDNAGLALFIQYGILSLVIMFCLVRSAKKALLVLYIILSLNFNGTFFRYDKALIISLTIGLSLKLSSENILRPAIANRRNTMRPTVTS